MFFRLPGRRLVQRTILPQILLAIVSLFLVCGEARSSPVLGSYTIQLQQHINDAAPFGHSLRESGPRPIPLRIWFAR
jgi:hypothetical protein